MATAEAETSSEERVPPGGSVYDGFISYSHAADDLLAPRLQAGLQRFAKPWWRRRALRIFRDEASLTANPHLWASITEALDESGWFILLLSPEAASSDWVNREVEYWLEHNGADRIIPVLTDGDFTWFDDDYISDAAPPALQGAFPDEPRWVDLRFARTEEQLDLKNPRFSAAIADVASAIRGVPKDELESEEVRQHRRTTRTIWAAGAALLTLGVLAFIAAAVAVGQSNEAQAQRDEAETQTEIALANEQRANEEADRANEEADRANQSASLLLGFVLQQVNTEIDLPGTDYENADIRSSMPVLDGPPATPRLDFLYDFCSGQVCNRDAQFVHPELPLIGGAVLAYQPFHIRHGFVNVEEAPIVPSSTIGPGYDVRVFVTRRHGPELGDGIFEIDQPYLFHADYMIRERSERCGPAYATQTEPQPCDVFVHEFPEGLPPGRYDIWVQWWAPCSEWVVADACPSPSQLVSLFNSNINHPFHHDDFTPADDPRGRGFPPWPYDPWQSADELPEP